MDIFGRRVLGGMFHLLLLRGSNATLSFQGLPGGGGVNGAQSSRAVKLCAQPQQPILLRLRGEVHEVRAAITYVPRRDHHFGQSVLPYQFIFSPLPTEELRKTQYWLLDRKNEPLLWHHNQGRRDVTPTEI